jgi:hypothetical protein|tara:strand:+ start:4411 stop:5037 length:627 start_codon:yes stop_codon:yes gene_type:complete
MGDVYRNYKLSSGDEVIGKLVGRNTRTVVLNRPMMVKTITLQDPMSGEQKDIMIMRPWASMTNELDQKIPVRHIIVETSPTPDVVGLYLGKLEKEDIVQDLVQEMLGDPEQLEEYLRNIIESDLDMPLSEEEEPQQDEDNVQMNFQIPPGLFLGFLMNGIVSLDPQNEGAEFDIDEFMKMKNEGNSKRKPRRKNKEIEDYFRDWTPEP